MNKITLCILFWIAKIFYFSTAFQSAWLTDEDFRRGQILADFDITDIRPAEYHGLTDFHVFGGKAFEGDLLHFDIAHVRALRDPVNFMSASMNANKKWPGAKIPYTLDGRFSSTFKALLANSISHIEQHTCIRFVPSIQYDGPAKVNPLNISKVDNGNCRSTIGLQSDSSIVFTEANCASSRTVIHELIHSIGFVHEHIREDRDRFVEIKFDNVKESSASNFVQYSINDNIRHLTPYDYGSIMHYEATAFAIDESKLTMISKTSTPVQDSVKHPSALVERMSRWDKIKINKYYACSEDNAKCKDIENSDYCRSKGLGVVDSSNNMDPAKAKCTDEAWSKKHCLKTCGDCYRQFGNARRSTARG